MNLDNRGIIFSKAALTVIQTHAMNQVWSIDIEELISDTNTLSQGHNFSRKDFDSASSYIFQTGYVINPSSPDKISRNL